LASQIFISFSNATTWLHFFCPLFFSYSLRFVFAAKLH
jgi:hypothetical protein